MIICLKKTLRENGRGIFNLKASKGTKWDRLMIISFTMTLREDERYVPQRDLVFQPSQVYLRQRRKNRPERRNLPFVLDTLLF